MSDALAVEHEHEHPNYMVVFWWLLGMTIVEVAIAQIPGISYNVLVVTLVALAFVKASLVALYFMHLRYDNKVLMIIAVVPVILVGIAISILSYEYTHYQITDTAKMKPLEKPLHGE